MNLIQTNTKQAGKPGKRECALGDSDKALVESVDFQVLAHAEIGGAVVELTEFSKSGTPLFYRLTQLLSHNVGYI